MKPTFALSLSFDGISLLHRCAGGWRSAGDVSLEATDLSAALAGLRGAAGRLDAGPLWTKLILPNEQIRYLSIETGATDGEGRDAAARAALEGATPYAVEDLVYDIATEGGVTHVAAVARETLDEAEAFAVEHGFNPVSFVAVPGDKPFLGEPFFGPTRHALTQLPAGEAVEPDGIAVVVVGPAQFPVDGQPPAPAPDPVTAVESAPPTVQSEKPVPAAPVAFSSRRRRPQSPASSEPAAEPVSPASPPAAAEPTPPAPADPPAAETAAKAVLRAEPAGDDPRSAPRVESPAPGAADTASQAPRISAPMRAAALAAAPPPEGPGDSGGFLRRRFSRSEDTAEIDVSGMPPRLAAAVLKTSAQNSDPLPAPPEDPVEAERMTVFGARQAADRSSGRTRYLGLILTAVLLLFLAGVAAWAALFLDEGVAGLFRAPDPETEIAAESSAESSAASIRVANDPTPAPEQPSPAPESGGAAPLTVQFSLPDFPSPDPGSAKALATPIGPEQPVTLASLDPASVLSETDIAVLDALRTQPREEGRIRPMDTETRYAVTGIWAAAPPEPDAPSIITLDGLYLGSIDNRDLSRDAVALPAVAGYASDLSIAAIVSPTPPETQFDLDERGLVRATPEGSLSPHGVLVYLGRPDVVPPPTPDRTQVVPEPDGIQERLAGFRPRSRPDDLAETTERGQLGGLTRNELAQIRPKTRPATQKAADEAADETATAQAVATTSRPRERPKGFSTRVAEQKVNPQNTQLAAIAPQTVTPTIPSKASVTRQATLNNAINLRQVNLIGVYGTPSNRRALVRLPSGRYKKVKVGDTVDGGRVVAIGDSELRYQKKGRNLTLRIPSG